MSYSDRLGRFKGIVVVAYVTGSEERLGSCSPDLTDSLWSGGAMVARHFPVSYLGEGCGFESRPDR